MYNHGHNVFRLLGKKNSSQVKRSAVITNKCGVTRDPLLEDAITRGLKMTGAACIFIKKRLWNWCFPVNFSKFLRTPFSQNTSGRLLFDKVKVYRQEFDSRCDESEQYSRRLCLGVKNIKKSDNENSEVVMESIRKLFDEANVVIPDTFIDRSQHVNKTNDTVVVCFTTFSHRNMFYRYRKALKGGVTVDLDLTKSRLDLLMKANKLQRTFLMLSLHTLILTTVSK